MKGSRQTTLPSIVEVGTEDEIGTDVMSWTVETEINGSGPTLNYMCTHTLSITRARDFN